MPRALKWFILTFSTVMLIDVVFDLGKWALGRFTEVNTPISILMIIGSSLVLASSVEVIHQLRRHREKQYEQYLHHKARVWVARDQKGQHRRSALCPVCEFSLPDTSENCLIESVVHTVSRDNHLVLVIWECPKFRKSMEIEGR